MSVVAIIQARMDSSRLRGKILKPLGEMPTIDRVVNRVKRSKLIEKIVIVTTSDPSDDVFCAYLDKKSYEYLRGSVDNVLERYWEAAKKHKAATIVRITADCPFIDPAIIDQVVAEHQKGKADYVSNVIPPTYPDGMDTEVFSFSALKAAYEGAKTPFEKEHVTTYLRQNDSIIRHNVSQPNDHSGYRLTLDELSDYDLLNRLYSKYSDAPLFDCEQLVHLIETDESLPTDNQNLKRDAGKNMGKGQKLWKRAKTIIPGGSMLLSKRVEMLLPEKWPAYFSSAKGCSVWSLDNDHYYDMCFMSVGTNTLGYGHPSVDQAVIDVIGKGNMSTLNAPEEVAVAERLIEIHDWADMVRFARSGGEANAIAVRIARAASGKDGIAICGYHGWHDWYLSTNLQKKDGLDGHHISGLKPKGVPKGLENTTHPFFYNDIGALLQIIKDHDIGVIKMEVMRNIEPDPGFLQAVRKAADDNNIVLIFDECTSGFRETFGGLHKKYGVSPDMAVFGKALGNGYAITAVIGTESVMQEAQSTFISSSFWTERIGSAAALKTLEVMEREKSWEVITQKGERMKRGWQKLADNHGLQITHQGISALASFTFDSKDFVSYKTYLTQEMMKKGYLAANAFYASTTHSDALIDNYLSDLDAVFQSIRKFVDGTCSVDEALETPPAHAGFFRLN